VGADRKHLHSTVLGVAYRCRIHDQERRRLRSNVWEDRSLVCEQLIN
jgi:hypothetical protein